MAGEDTYVNLNRSGVPLIEMVTKPDIRSSQEAYDFLTHIRRILLYLAICDGNMEEGSLRCDANVSVRPAGSSRLGTKTEIKNVNSFRFLQKALDYEIERQIDLIQRGGQVEQETRLWDEEHQNTFPMRRKEEAHNYRYFPDPDLLPVVISEEWLESLRKEIPELPEARSERFVQEYGLGRGGRRANHPDKAFRGLLRDGDEGACPAQVHLQLDAWGPDSLPQARQSLHRRLPRQTRASGPNGSVARRGNHQQQDWQGGV